MTAKDFITQLSSHQTPADSEKNQRYFRGETTHPNKFFGVRMKLVFDTAKDFKELPLSEVEKLLKNPHYEIRLGAVSVMDFKAREKKITEEERKKLFDLYLKHHDRIDNWDLVDRSAPYVIGGYLVDKPRDILYKLARSKDVWERRTAIVSTYYFIRQGDVNDTFRIGELLLKDKHDLIHKAVGSWIREAGKKDKPALIKFLDRHSASMPRAMLSYAIENLDKKQKEKYSSKD